jgi:hypothetical protein
LTFLVANAGEGARIKLKLVNIRSYLALKKLYYFIGLTFNIYYT